MSRRPGRQGLFWILVVLLALAAGADLLRGRESLLRGWWSGLPVTRGEANRSLIRDFLDRARRR